MLEVFMLVLGAVGTIAIGSPVALRLARAGFVDREGSAGDLGASRSGGQSAGFTPLDFGEDPVEWPSANPWPASKLPVPEWPSKGWDDEHFGRHWKEQEAVGSTPADSASQRPAPKVSAERRARQKQAERQKKEQTQRRQEKAQRRQEQQDQRSRQQQTDREAMQRVAARQALEQQQKARAQQAARQQKQAAAARPSAPQPQVDAPGRDELLAMVESVGLAGTVQQIMKRTGWDFRRAAQYLAKVRSGG